MKRTNPTRVTAGSSQGVKRRVSLPQRRLESPNLDCYSAEGGGRSGGKAEKKFEKIS